MNLTAAIREVTSGFKSLLTGLRITFGQAMQPPVTVQYPRETLPLPERFRGHIKLLLDPATGKSRCTACGLCVRACPSECITVDGVKREGEKKKSVTLYQLDFTTCSLCGSCVEVCPSDAIGFSKDYNIVSLSREPFSQMDLVKRLEQEAEAWARSRPAPPPAALPAADPVPGKAETPEARPVA